MADKNNKFSDIRNKSEFPDPKSVTMSNIVEDVWETYVDEIRTFLQDLEKSAMTLESSDNNESNEKELAEIRRILHSIKGDSGMAGINDIHDLCHELETDLDSLYEKGALTDALLKSKDWIESAVDYILSKDLSTEKGLEQDEIMNKPKVKALVIDDDVICRKRLKMLLEDYFDCTYACNGKEGLIAYKQSLTDNEPFKLVTLDINMPEMNGHETLEAIRKFEEKNGIMGLDGVKVIMTTSESGSEHVFSAFRQGCEAYVVKVDMGAKLLDEIAKLGLLKVVKVQKAYALD